MRLSQVLLSLILFITLVSCGSRNYASLDDISGRTSMGKRDPFQCYELGGYSADEQVDGAWIAGLDGGSLGATHDNSTPAKCGTKFTIKNTKSGQEAQFIVADRIWENDGVGGCLYKNKSDADNKTNCAGSGYQQVDIAVGAYNLLFNGQNPGPNDYSISGI